MKLLVLSLAILGLVASSYAGAIPKVKCDAATCVLPDCFCSGITPPINPRFPEDNPQIVYLTFDDAITVTNYPLYQEIFAGRVNPNGAPITGSFYITHEYNNYSLTHQMYRQGHEIALHSITHKSATTYWKDLTEAEWTEEVIKQRAQVANFANFDETEIVGFRAPFLQGGGDVMYSALHKGGLKYESSRPSWRIRPNLFPYTMDFDTVQDCQIEPCPTGVYPGFWASPLVDLLGTNGQPCAFVDTCLDAPKTADETFDFINKNFEDHYYDKRAPFGLYVHAGWLMNAEAPWIKEGYLKFLDYILAVEDKDVFVVSIKKGLEWMQNPVGLADIATFAPWQATEIRDGCRNPFTCIFDTAHTPEGMGERLMSSCNLCPTNYPWLGNPLGD